MLKGSLGLYPTPLGIHCHCSTSMCSNSGIVADGKGYDHIYADVEYPRGGRSEMDQDSKALSRGYDTTSLQTVPCHTTGMLALSCWKKKCFQQSDKFAGHVGEGLLLHSFGL